MKKIQSDRSYISSSILVFHPFSRDMDMLRFGLVQIHPCMPKPKLLEHLAIIMESHVDPQQGQEDILQVEIHLEVTTILTVVKVEAMAVVHIHLKDGLPHMVLAACQVLVLAEVEVAAMDLEALITPTVVHTGLLELDVAQI